MPYQRLFPLLVAMLGAILGAMGLLTFAIVTSGHVLQGRAGLLVTGAGLLLVAAPAVAWPFSIRTARGLLLLALVCLAALSLWLSFWPRAEVMVSPLTRPAVVAFVALLVVRVSLVVRRGKATPAP
jgi:hypothetical protein